MNSLETVLSSLSHSKQQALELIKRHGACSVAELAAELQTSHQGTRQQVHTLLREGWVKRAQRRSGAASGRPAAVFSLTVAGEHLFPKAYDQLALDLIDSTADSLGPDALKRVLERIVDRKVQQWLPNLSGKPLEQRLQALKELYINGDPYMEVTEDEDGLSLIENNCPFFAVAQSRPALCSVSVNLVSRLVGYRVRRDERFQDGDGRCVFRVLLDQPLAHGEDETFEFEPQPMERT